MEHNKYDNNKNIFIRTTERYTFDNDLVNQGDNRKVLEKLFKDELKENDIEKYLTNSKNKTEAMYKICEEMLENKIQIELPKHIKEIIDKVCERAKYKLQEQEKHMD